MKLVHFKVPVKTINVTPLILEQKKEKCILRGCLSVFLYKFPFLNVLSPNLRTEVMRLRHIKKFLIERLEVKRGNLLTIVLLRKAPTI